MNSKKNLAFIENLIKLSLNNEMAWHTPGGEFVRKYHQEFSGEKSRASLLKGFIFLFSASANNEKIKLSCIQNEQLIEIFSRKIFGDNEFNVDRLIIISGLDNLFIKNIQNIFNASAAESPANLLAKN